MSKKTLKIEVEITEETLNDLMVDALEGGSNYWYCIIEYGVKPAKTNYTSEYPMKGGYLMINDSMADDPIIKNPVKLDKERCFAGIRLLAKKEPETFAEILSGNYDANTADIFLQYCIFKKVIYG